MSSFAALVVAGIGCGTAFFALRALFRAWLRHQLRLALLARFESAPPAPDQETAAKRLLAELVPPERPSRQDFRVTGLALCAFGVLSAFSGRCIGTGILAVGLYEGGRASAWLGLAIGAAALLGHIARRYRRRATETSAQ